jgi:hypothetical protein
MSRAIVLAVVALCCLLPAAQAGDRPLRDWINDLDDASVLVRLEAIEVLADAGADATDAVPRLEKLAKSESLQLRLPAALAIYRISGTRGPAIAALTAMLRSDTGPQAKARALAALHLLGAASAAAAPEMLALVDHPEAMLRSRALAVLACLGRPVVPAVLERLADLQPERRRQAAHAVVRLHRWVDEDGAKAIAQRLEDSDSTVRLCCARALWARGNSSTALVKVLTDAVRHSELVAHPVLDSIEETADPRQRGTARPILEAALHSDRLSIQVRAARQLYRLDGNADAVLPIYLAALKNPDHRLYGPTVDGLKELGPRAAPAVPRLMALMRDEGLEHIDFAEVFACIGPAAVPPLVDALKEARGSLFGVNIRMALDVLADEAFGRVVPLLNHADARVRQAACEILGGTIRQRKNAARLLKPLLMDAALQVQGAARAALGRIEAAGAGKTQDDDPATPRPPSPPTGGPAEARRLAQALLAGLRKEPPRWPGWVDLQLLKQLDRKVSEPEVTKVVPVLLECLDQDGGTFDWAHPSVTERAAELLATIAPEPTRRQAVRRLEKRLFAEDEPIKIAVALVHLDKGHPGAIATLLRVVAEPDSARDPIAETALSMLREAGPAAKEALGDLRALLTDRRLFIPLSAAEAIWRISKDADACLPVALEGIGPGQRTDVRQVAHAFLVEMGPAAKAALPALLALRKKYPALDRPLMAKTIRAIDPTALKEIPSD